MLVINIRTLNCVNWIVSDFDQVQLEVLPSWMANEGVSIILAPYLCLEKISSGMDAFWGLSSITTGTGIREGKTKTKQNKNNPEPDLSQIGHFLKGACRYEFLQRGTKRGSDNLGLRIRGLK